MRHVAAEVDVAALEDDADAAAGDLAQHLVVAAAVGQELAGRAAHGDEGRGAVARALFAQQHLGGLAGQALDGLEDGLGRRRLGARVGGRRSVGHGTGEAARRREERTASASWDGRFRSVG